MQGFEWTHWDDLAPWTWIMNSKTCLPYKDDNISMLSGLHLTPYLSLFNFSSCSFSAFTWAAISRLRFTTDAMSVGSSSGTPLVAAGFLSTFLVLFFGAGFFGAVSPPSTKHKCKNNHYTRIYLTRHRQIRQWRPTIRESKLCRNLWIILY